MILTFLLSDQNKLMNRIPGTTFVIFTKPDFCFNKTLEYAPFLLRRFCPRNNLKVNEIKLKFIERISLND